jgi:molybdenum cofactor cytidylyltransferase
MPVVIPAVVLAAGKSTRMGRLKAMLPLDGRDTFLTRIVQTFRAAGVDEVVVVVGHEGEAVIEDARERGAIARFVTNDRYESGQLSSVLAGLEAVDRPGTAALLLTLVDVPMIAAATVQAVLARYRDTGAPIVRPVNGDLHGHPVLIDRSLFGRLRQADAASGGAKPIVRGYASAVGDVTVNDPGAFRDIDTPDDYEQLLAEVQSDAGGYGRFRRSV